MKLKNIELYNMFTEIQDYRNESFPAKVSFIIVQNQKKIWSILQDYLEAKNETIEKYCTRIGNTDKFELPSEDSPYWKEIEDLDNTESEIELRKFSAQDLGDKELPLYVSNALLPMVEEE